VKKIREGNRSAPDRLSFLGSWNLEDPNSDGSRVCEGCNRRGGILASFRELKSSDFSVCCMPRQIDSNFRARLESTFKQGRPGEGGGLLYKASSDHQI